MTKDENVSIHRLLVQLKGGDDKAIDLFYPRYAKKFYDHARGKGLSHEVAEDIVQTTFLHIFQGIQTYDETKGGGAGWMWTICNNLVTDHLRRYKETASFLDSLTSPGNTDPARRYEHKEFYEAFIRAWEKLSQADRKEIVCGPGRGPGRTAWHKAVEQLRILLSKETER